MSRSVLVFTPIDLCIGRGRGWMQKRVSDNAASEVTAKLILRSIEARPPGHFQKLIGTKYGIHIDVCLFGSHLEPQISIVVTIYNNYDRSTVKTSDGWLRILIEDEQTLSDLAKALWEISNEQYGATLRISERRVSTGCNDGEVCLWSDISEWRVERAQQAIPQAS